MPSSIIEYFRETFETSLLEEGNFRTWGHIEWSTQDSLEEELLTYEMEVGRLISEHNLIAVCAYDAMRVNEDLREQLGKAAREDALSRFSVATHVQSVCAIYEEMLDGK